MRDGQAGYVERFWRTTLVAWTRLRRDPHTVGNQARALLPRRPDVYIPFAAAIVLIAFCMMVVDAPVIRITRPYYVEHEGSVIYFKQLTKLGSSGWILIITGALGAYLAATRWETFPRHERLRLVHWHADVSFIFFTTAITGSAVWLIKSALGRARPRLLEEFGHLYFEVGAFEAAFASFPSGHSTTFGSLGMALALIFPRHRTFWICFGIFGAATRILVGAHYPSDVIAGLICGAGFALLAARYLASRSTMFRYDHSSLPMRKRYPSRKAVKDLTVRRALQIPVPGQR
ncbi:MAG: phosphatase PAP2 family protein [Ahrensia sp.]|nr:phosphatase PAP2 family protein [Ahrensia sp.]